MKEVVSKADPAVMHNSERSEIFRDFLKMYGGDKWARTLRNLFIC